MPPFSPWQRIPTSGTHCTLGEIGFAVCQSGSHMCLGDMQAPDIVQAAVVALADDRVHTAGGLADIGVALQHIFDQRRLHGAHTQGVGKQDGGLQRAQLIDLDKAGGLPKPLMTWQAASTLSWNTSPG